MEYSHLDNQGQPITLPKGKVVCVGRNYLMHIKELNNEVPSQPLLFIKPSTALVPLSQPVVIPKDLGACHNEIEVAVLIKSTFSKGNRQSAEAAIWGVGLGLDLTLREVQTELKSKGHPWERAKAFDGSCPMSQFVDITQVENLSDLSFCLCVNKLPRQQGNTQHMLFNILDLIADISQSFTLLPGDIVMTGTPKGVDALQPNDQLDIQLEGYFSLNSYVA